MNFHLLLPAFRVDSALAESRRAGPFHVQSASFKGWAGKSALELLIALAMLGMILLLAVPNLLPLLRSSGDRHHADALAFFVDDLRVLSATQNRWIEVPADLPAEHVFARYGKLQKERYPSLSAVFAAQQVKVLQPFAFYKGRFLGESSFGRLWLKGKVTQRIVDVTATGEVCVYRVKDLKSLLPRACAAAKKSLQPKTLSWGCGQTSKSSGLSFLALLFLLRGHGTLRRKIHRRKSKNKRPFRRNLRGYVLIEAVVAALLLILCVGLVYSYVGRVRRETGFSKSAELEKSSYQRTKSQKIKEERVQIELRNRLRSLPDALKEGAIAIAGSSLLHTLQIVERRKELVKIRLAVVDQNADAAVDVLLWVKKSRLNGPESSHSLGAKEEKNKENLAAVKDSEVKKMHSAPEKKQVRP